MLLRYSLVVSTWAATCLSLIGCAAPLTTGGAWFARGGDHAREAPSPATKTANLNSTDSGHVANVDRARHREVLDENNVMPHAAMAQVLEDLEEIRSIDRHAQRQLLAELKNAPAEDWPLMVRQYRSALTYRTELREKVLDRDRTTQERPSRREEETRTISSWRTATQRALDADDQWEEPSSDTEQLDASLLDPRRMPDDDDPAAAFTAAGASRLERDFARKSPPHIDRHVEPAVFATDEVDRTVESAAWLDDINRKTVEVEDLPKRLPADLSWRQHLTAAIHGLSTVPEDDTRSDSAVGLSEQVRLRLLQLVAGDTDSAMTPIPHLSTTEQDYWTKQLFSLATYTDDSMQLNQERRAALAADHLEDALGQLRELSTLRVHNMAFCKQVYDFGAYDSYPNHRFAAGRQVTLYAEVENYRSRLTEKGFQTSLASSYEVVNDQGDRLAGGDFPQVDDYCRSRRRDFHIQYTLPLPAAARPGGYRLKLTIVDNLSGKQGQNVIEFQIVESGHAPTP